MIKPFVNIFLFVLIAIIFMIVVSYQGVQGFVTPAVQTTIRTPMLQRIPINIPSANVRLLTPPALAVAQYEEVDNKNRFIGGRSSTTPSAVHSSLGDVNMEFKQPTKKESIGFVFDEAGRKFDSIGEKLSCKIFEEFIKRKAILHQRPDWLKNPLTGRNLEIDIYDPKTNIGIEYNGAQHYRYEQSMHKSVNDFNYQVYKDQLKLERCRMRGTSLIVVPYTVDNMKYTNGKMKFCRMSESEKEVKLRNYILPQLETIFSEKFGTKNPDDIDYINNTRDRSSSLTDIHGNRIPIAYKKLETQWII